MRRGGIVAIGIASAIALAVSGCADNSSSSGGDDIKLGLLTSLSGPASSTFKNTKIGVQARLDAYKAEGGKCADKNITFVEADDASTTQGALSGTQKLVQQDKVYALLDVSSSFFGASPWVTTTGKATPVLGGGFDGPEWLKPSPNLFSALPVPDFTKNYATTGNYFKSVGATRVAALAYNNPSSIHSVETNLASIKAAGIAEGYVNKTIPTGSTDVGAIVLGIIKSKADAVAMSINPDTAFAVVAGLRQANYKTKAILTATGYGADLLESAPAVAAAQDVTFLTGWAPVELQTPATKLLSKYMTAAGVKGGIPGFNQGIGWLETDLFLHGLEKAGCDASQADFLKALKPDKTWNAGGLYKNAADFENLSLKESCQYFLRLKGKVFVPEPNATPICGGVIS